MTKVTSPPSPMSIDAAPISTATPMKSAQPKGSGTGALYALAAFLAWGFNPVYFKAVEDVPVVEVVAHRIVWAVLLLSVVVSVGRRWPAIARALTDRRAMGALAISTVLLSSNWGLYVWAVANERILETSIGYFINPLVSMLLGVVFLGERLNRVQMLAIALAVAGVSYLTWSYGSAPWIALYLAGSFGLYGFVRKTAPVNALGGLFIETLIVVPFALGYLVWLQVMGDAAFRSAGPGFDLLLILSGPVTALPLLWFSAAARRLNLSTVGFFQYIAPSTQFLLAIFAYGEPFTPAHAVTFPLIWTALAIFTVDAMRRRRRRRAETA
ncbi:MAG TPA: EamA family transporter RarD [Methylomirabilota bacterium]|nr:EamA family transporter RarD [Methylomirabilota bacterium]